MDKEYQSLIYFGFKATTMDPGNMGIPFIIQTGLS